MNTCNEGPGANERASRGPEFSTAVLNLVLSSTAVHVLPRARARARTHSHYYLKLLPPDNLNLSV